MGWARCGSRPAGKWRYIDGIAALFSGHGYCVSGKGAWVVKLTRSFLGQGRADGTVHPNAEGHRQMAGLIARALVPAPRSPEAAREAAEANEPVSDTAAGWLGGSAVAVAAGLVGVFLRANVPRWRLSRRG